MNDDEEYDYNTDGGHPSWGSGQRVTCADCNKFKTNKCPYPKTKGLVCSDFWM